MSDLVIGAVVVVIETLVHAWAALTDLIKVLTWS